MNPDTDLFGNPLVDSAPGPIAAPCCRSRKQKAIAEFLREHGTMSLTDATNLVGGDVYRNEKIHTGHLLSNMVRRGLLVRVKPGLFKLP